MPASVKIFGVFRQVRIRLGYDFTMPFNAYFRQTHELIRFDFFHQRIVVANLLGFPQLYPLPELPPFEGDKLNVLLRLRFFYGLSI